MLGPVGYERVWERLLEYLGELGDAQEVEGGIEVTIRRPRGPEQVVEVVVTRLDWDNYVSIIYGDGDPARTPIRGRVLAVPRERRFLVYDGAYDWQSCATRTLPPDPGPDGARGGHWFVEGR